MLVRWLLTGRSTGRREQRAVGRARAEATAPVAFADLGCAARESLAVDRKANRRLEASRAVRRIECRASLAYLADRIPWVSRRASGIVSLRSISID